MTARMLVAAILLAGTAGPALAQNVRADPTYGTINLNADFPDDPRTVDLQSGGSIDASRLGGACRGFIAGPPDVRVNYRAGNFPLTFFVNSDADTTLVINGPDGRWYCNDDANGVNPAFRFTNPASGQYDIWIGTFGNRGLNDARLSITELNR